MTWSSLYLCISRHGAEEVKGEDPRPARGAPTFKGSGYKLGDTEGTQSERITGAPVAMQRRQVLLLVQG